jgi:hypothetical protein
MTITESIAAAVDHDSSRPTSQTSHDRPERRGARATWALAGASAGLLGFLGLMFDGSASLEDTDYLKGADVVDLVDRGAYHIGLLLGLAAVFALLVNAAGWRRWVERAAPDNLMARLIPYGMIATAGAMILGYGFKGSFAVYLEGGIDEGTMTKEGLYSVFMFLDFAPFMAWWGVTAAAVAITWLSLRHGLVPRWIGVLSAVMTLLPLAVVSITGLPGISFVSTVWLVVASVGVAASRRFAGVGAA